MGSETLQRLLAEASETRRLLHRVGPENEAKVTALFAEFCVWTGCDVERAILVASEFIAEMRSKGAP